MKFILLLLITFICSLTCQAQLVTKWKTDKYFNVDIHVTRTPDSVTTDIKKLANYLTRPFAHEEQKLRAVYYWITHNITYDVDKLARMNSNLNPPTPPNPRTTLKIRKGVCGDYADLFTELCHLSGVACYTVSGWSNIGGVNNLHAWNVVRIGKEWHLIETTWGSGFINVANNKFVRNFDENFFLQNPQEFVKNHYPSDPMWQLLEFPISYQDFINRNNTNKTDKLDFQNEITAWVFQNTKEQLENSIERSLTFAKTNTTDILFVSAKQELSLAYYNEAVFKYNRGVNLYNKYVNYNNSNLSIPLMFRKRKSLALLEASENEMITAVEMLSHNIFQDDCCTQTTQPLKTEATLILDKIDKDKQLYGSRGKSK